MKSQEFNSELLTAIKDAGFTQREVADKIGVHESRVSRWICNANMIPHSKHREALKRLGINVYGE